MAQARGAVSTMLAELGDRYTRYLTPGAYASLLAKYERPADNGGIGVTVRNVVWHGTGAVEIVSVIEGAPAAAAGLRVGDVFETIDGRSLPVDATADDIAGMLLGRLEEPVSLSVRRAGALQRVHCSACVAPCVAPCVASCVLSCTAPCFAPCTAPHTAPHTAHRTAPCIALTPGRAACRRLHRELHVAAGRPQGGRG